MDIICIVDYKSLNDNVGLGMCLDYNHPTNKVFVVLIM
jgi:hypothetical protein